MQASFSHSVLWSEGQIVDAGVVTIEQKGVEHGRDE